MYERMYMDMLCEFIIFLLFVNIYFIFFSVIYSAQFPADCVWQCPVYDEILAFSDEVPCGFPSSPKFQVS